MTNKNKVKPAVLSFLEELKKEGVTTINETSIHHESSLNKNDNEAQFTHQEKAYLVKLLPTKEITLWRLANRLVINEKTAAELIESISLNGQRVPVIVRRNKSNNGYELICGARRLFACKSLGIDILSAITELSDQEAALVMDLENREREDISPYERGLDYKHWVEEGIYKNYAEICEKTGIKKALLSKLVAIADLHPTIVQAFSVPSELKYRWAYDLVQLYKANTLHQKSMLKKAQELIGKDLPSAKVFSELMSSVETNTTQAYVGSASKVIKNNAGEKIVQISKKHNEIKLKFLNRIEEEKAEKVMKEIVTALEKVSRGKLFD